MADILEIRKKYSNTKQVAEEVYLTLREAMIANVMKSGERLQEEKITKLFDVSRTPVREAVKRLEYEGFITYDLRYGFQVRLFSPEECIQLVEALEYMRQITTRVAAETITRANIMRLTDNIKRTRESVEANRDDVVTLFESFHAIIAESVNNEVIHKCYSDMAQKYAFVLNRYEQRVYNVDAVDDHANICDAVAAHDKERAWLLAIAHTEKTSNRIKQFLL